MMLLLICVLGSAECRVLRHYDSYAICARAGMALADRFAADFTCATRSLVVTDKDDPNHVWRIM